jgi:hypothetical protein
MSVSPRTSTQDMVSNCDALVPALFGLHVARYDLKPEKIAVLPRVLNSRWCLPRLFH